MVEKIDTLLENESLKNEFKLRNLDLSQVFFPVPDDLERENRILRNLLDWVQAYSECGDRKIMEIQGYQFPPIEPDFDPDNDWFIFERWMNGLPVYMRIKDALGPDYVIKDPEELNDDQLALEIDKLLEVLDEHRIGVDFREEVPLRLVYIQILGYLDNQVQLKDSGCLVYDGCSGCCPGCFQRPWCQNGCESCWPEDESAGKIVFHDSAEAYVCPSPVSLQIIRERQVKKDKEYEEFLKKHKNSEITIDPLPPDFGDADNDDLPF